MAAGLMKPPPGKSNLTGADASPRLLFITGTDTGAGKTLLTALLLAHARSKGIVAVALKPFCSGGRSDAILLHSLTENSVTLDRVNPFHYPQPLTPLLAARTRNKAISLRQVTAHTASIARD